MNQAKIKSGNVFICGPINRDLLETEKDFAKKEETLNSLGVRTINQFMLFHSAGMFLALKPTVQFLANCNVIVTLPNWASCEFAKKQVEIARIMEIDVIDYSKLILDLTKKVD